MKKLVLNSLCLLFANCLQAQIVTFQSELEQLTDLSLLPKYRTGTVVGQQSSYDRSGGNDDGTDRYLKRNPDSSLVMLDITGPGVLNRFWTPVPTKDTLDLLIDDRTKPVLSICFSDLFNGKVFPFIQPLSGNAVGGYYCYLPIPFQKHLKVVSRGHHLSYYQCQYRIFPKHTKVKSFELPLSLADSKALENVKLAWDAIMTAKSPMLETTAISPGQIKAIYRTEHGGRINSIIIDTTGTRDLSLRITWDDEKLPAIEMPLRDFFGYAFGQPAMQGLLAGTAAYHYCRCPMPFDQSARIEIVNNGVKSINVSFHITFERKKRNSKTEGRFYASFADKQLTKNDAFHVFLAVKGKGHYVGTNLRSRGNYDGMTSFFEGDDSTATDGIARMHGTGSEDYFNGGWYDIKGRWDHAESLPLSGCLGYGQIPAHTGGYRFYLVDKIPFEKSFWHGIEHGGDAKQSVIPANYTSVSYYYCDQRQSEQLYNNL